MFTGIVETTGEILSVGATDGGVHLSITAPGVAEGLRVGASISVNGTCLTAVTIAVPAFEVDVVAETLARTNLGGLAAGDRVNLERAMPAGGRFDGHIVQGHIDGIGTISSITSEGSSWRMSIETPRSLLRHVVEKGSIAVDGVSLTVAAVTEIGFEVALIPHTLAETTLGDRAVGDRVNLEVDILAKYVERLLSPPS
ncbi:MAG: riboflavin synthase [Acidimicrobiia bacterium]